MAETFNVKLNVPKIGNQATKMSSVAVCVVCGVDEHLLRCSRCKLVFYCSKEHQKLDWKKHKSSCQKPAEETKSSEKSETTTIKENATTSQEEASAQQSTTYNKIHKIEQPGSSKSNKKSSEPITNEGSSEKEILNAGTESLSPHLEVAEKSTTEKTLRCAKSALPIQGENRVLPKKSSVQDFPEISLKKDIMPSFLQQNNLDEICRCVVKDMDNYGVCVVNNFLGEELGKAVLSEVLNMYSSGVFKDGQLVSNKGRKNDAKSIRGDQITWIDGREEYCSNIGYLISQVDAVITKSNKMANNGKMGDYTINGRTKAMVACYPGSGSHYVKHVDNPNRDGRCITAIYYLNLDWDVKLSGGLLRIFPEGWRGDRIADIEPLFDRLLFFWSDRRNPHEVQPAYQTRYAITLWYFDAVEREEACRRYHNQKDRNMAKPPIIAK